MQLTKHWAGQLDDYAIDLAWSPNGTQLAAASAAGPVTIFAAEDGARQHELPGHENGTNVLAWQPSASRPIGTAAESAATSDPAASRRLHAAATLATGGQDGAVKFWDAAAGQHTGTAKLGTAWVELLAWQPRRSSFGRSGPRLRC